MNILSGKIASIKVNGDLSIVRVYVGSEIFSSILIDTPDTAEFLRVGNEVKVIFKETEVILGVGDMSGISLRNKLNGRVSSIESDTLLSKVSIETEVGLITSIITSNAVEQLNIKNNMDLTAMIKTNELILAK
ncbi:TOBE domain-containing protein [Lutimonas zeaxanthinifaciens]|uniref:TOBE domain-containing protein n=1 Tax=Lutimonas zeaxanthinifaciens TaxID=3060215 RepID=UPI00265D4CD9|nr:TOBE domain-containing protein [Lutimonas sp. YSD2104]WKK65309.1 TOBE domain-containing protein [Lutimonas sp. YSD2104]